MLGSGQCGERNLFLARTVIHYFLILFAFACFHSRNQSRTHSQPGMGFSLYNIFKAGLLLLNAFTILHPKRFLKRYGLDQPDLSEGQTLKNQAVGLLQAVGYLKGIARVPILCTSCQLTLPYHPLFNIFVNNSSFCYSSFDCCQQLDNFRGNSGWRLKRAPRLFWFLFRPWLYSRR